MVWDQTQSAGLRVGSLAILLCRDQQHWREEPLQESQPSLLHERSATASEEDKYVSLNGRSSEQLFGVCVCVEAELVFPAPNLYNAAKSSDYAGRHFPSFTISTTNKRKKTGMKIHSVYCANNCL